MSVTIEGSIDGRAMSLSYDNGELSGDDAAAAVVREFVRAGIDTCIPGIAAGPAALDDDLIAAATFVAVFDEGARLNVQSPLLEIDLPAGSAQ